MVNIDTDKWFFVLGDKKPSIECPSCGCQLLGDRAIQGVKENGEVYNSVVCPCGFHDYVKLLGWNKGHIQRGKKTN